MNTGTPQEADVIRLARTLESYCADPSWKRCRWSSKRS